MENHKKAPVYTGNQLFDVAIEVMRLKQIAKIDKLKKEIDSKPDYKKACDIERQKYNVLVDKVNDTQSGIREKIDTLGELMAQRKVLDNATDAYHKSILKDDYKTQKKIDDLRQELEDFGCFVQYFTSNFDMNISFNYHFFPAKGFDTGLQKEKDKARKDLIDKYDLFGTRAASEAKKNDNPTPDDLFSKKT